MLKKSNIQYQYVIYENIFNLRFGTLDLRCQRKYIDEKIQLYRYLLFLYYYIPKLL